MLPSDELNDIREKQGIIIGKMVLNLFADFQKQSPVKTEAFKGAWDIEQVGDMEWRISNNMEYATILFDGRRIVAGKAQGSEQWPEGGFPMLERFNDELQRRLDDL